MFQGTWSCLFLDFKVFISARASRSLSSYFWFTLVNSSKSWSQIYRGYTLDYDREQNIFPQTNFCWPKVWLQFFTLFSSPLMVSTLSHNNFSTSLNLFLSPSLSGRNKSKSFSKSCDTLESNSTSEYSGILLLSASPRLTLGFSWMWIVFVRLAFTEFGVIMRIFLSEPQ